MPPKNCQPALTTLGSEETIECCAVSEQPCKTPQRDITETLLQSGHIALGGRGICAATAWGLLSSGMQERAKSEGGDGSLRLGGLDRRKQAAENLRQRKTRSRGKALSLSSAGASFFIEHLYPRKRPRLAR